jgi:hypothetical protein
VTPPVSPGRGQRRRAEAGKFSPLALAKLAVREQSVRHALHLQAAGIGFETALQRTARDFQIRTSVTSVRRWIRRYEEAGSAGLVERKAGRSGRKPSSK